MNVGLVGVKSGMSTYFNDDGTSEPITIIEVQPNRVVQLKTVEVDGYSALQVAIGHKKDKSTGFNQISKPVKGHYEKSSVPLGEKLTEIRVDPTALEAVKKMASESEGDFVQISLGDVEFYQPGALIDVTGITKGKGFAGVVKRHNFSTQDATHGNSLSHRAPGSIGQCQTPGRVFKGKKMAGHMGNVQRTVQRLKVIKVDAEKNLLFVKGSIPGKNGGYVKVKPSVKC